jgi:GNAT superfamily N-acetyltransferase
VTQSASLEQAMSLVRFADAITAPLELVTRPIDGGWVDATRSYPTYFHGNRLFLQSPPAPEDQDLLAARYDTIFAWRRSFAPRVVTWCVPVNAAPTVVPHGAEIEDAIALLIHPTPSSECVSSEARLRAIVDRADWQELIDAERAENPDHGTFVDWRFRTFAQLVRAGRGQWYALENTSGTTVATAGLFVRDDVARFANVLTFAPYRNRGYGRALIQAMLATLPTAVSRAVIVAERGSPGEALYRSLGFEAFVAVRSMLF